MSDPQSINCCDTTDNGIISVPLLEVKASAGTGIENYSERVVRKIEFFENWLRQNVSFSTPTKLEMITASGDSMEPTISANDILLVDRSVTEILYDSIYVALINGEVYVKRFQRTPSRTLLMISDNAKYKAFELKPEDSIQILGRVVYHWTGGTL